MNAYIDTLLDKNGQKFYPKTKTSAVYDDDNNTLDSVIANKLDKYASGSSDWDSAPTQNSTKAVTSGGIYQAIDNSTSNKLDKYTSGSSDWDTAPTQNSTKAVTSGGVYQAIDDVKDDLGDPSSASAVTGDDAFSKISTLNSDLASKLNWKVAGAFNSNGSVTLNYSLDSASEIKITLFLGMPRQTVLIESISRLRQYSLFPDFMTSDGRVYTQVSYVDATHVNISQLTGLSEVGSTAQFIIEIR